MKKWYDDGRPVWDGLRRGKQGRPQQSTGRPARCSADIGHIANQLCGGGVHRMGDVPYLTTSTKVTMMTGTGTGRAFQLDGDTRVKTEWMLSDDWTRTYFPGGRTGSTYQGAHQQFGLSSRVRGNRGRHPQPPSVHGSIPAPAGDPLSILSSTIFTVVYPYACGEIRQGTRWTLPAAGRNPPTAPPSVTRPGPISRSWTSNPGCPTAHAPPVA